MVKIISRPAARAASTGARGQDVVGVFLLPPSLGELEQRLRLRGEDSEAEIARRMASTAGEMEHAPEFDYIVINDDFAAALARLRAILQAERLATRRQTGLEAFTHHTVHHPVAGEGG